MDKFSAKYGYNIHQLNKKHKSLLLYLSYFPSTNFQSPPPFYSTLELKLTRGHFTVLSCVMTLWLRQQINKKGNHFSMEASLLTQWIVTFEVIFVPYDCAKTNFRFNTCLIYGNNDWLRINFYNWITVWAHLELCISRSYML